ncbi:hypothetical protein TSTA_014660 [Talaromyces stipitatus ATCC 10500]|uniref:Uncharacterized protein n=1 Tax=Talaromyces stipitatus (strain ATCC 10500 / CBS 375.48 / QM 6759 / NRRL 1006) TaxID=441959 RepID=B8MGZ3_TALSN|nr:uncharacterized protein TSTA_014660 [Talaromyces stipitatus ATCC 10500]EED16374.1 hypothetical protein TSTA_014660 [Talaromyces stipitatus ATCC 10500]
MFEHNLYRSTKKGISGPPSYSTTQNGSNNQEPKASAGQQNSSVEPDYNGQKASQGASQYVQM